MLASSPFPFALGVAIGGSLMAGLTGMLWGGLVRMLVLHHVTYSINSLCHFFGRRTFETDDHSRDLAWLAPLSFGEAWHNGHHAFPTSARHGLGAGRSISRRWVICGAREARPRLGRRSDRPTARRGQAAHLMAFADPGVLRREIERAVPDRPFAIAWWDGKRAPRDVQRGAASSRARSPHAVAHALLAPGQLGLSRAYVSGELEIDDLDAVLALLRDWTPPAIDTARGAGVLLAAARAVGVRSRPAAPAARSSFARAAGATASKRDARAVRHHYDVSNEFFAPLPGRPR